MGLEDTIVREEHRDSEKIPSKVQLRVARHFRKTEEGALEIERLLGESAREHREGGLSVSEAQLLHELIDDVARESIHREADVGVFERKEGCSGPAEGDNEDQRGGNRVEQNRDGEGFFL